jgi:undecaprenyl-phosphate 4-deoxy-4-formamido-L-arabinose transferase
MDRQINNRAMSVNSLSVVIPVYNSGAALPALIERLQPVLSVRAAQVEVLLVNDGSGDDSWEMICKLAAQRDWVRGINLMRNYGQHNALLCGIRAARYEIIVTMDDDLQHPPEEIPKLLSKLSEGYDVVYGTPLKEQHGIWRDMASRITKLVLQGAMGADVARQVSAFRALRTQVRDAFTAYQSPFISIDVLLTWGTTRFTAIPVRHDARATGVSNYTLRKLITHAINMMTGFSTLPLQLASLIGFSFTLFGLAVLVYVIVAYLVYGDRVPGFPFLASVISIFSGAQLFALGIIGEYLARIHFRTMDRPAYTVRSDTITN